MREGARCGFSSRDGLHFGGAFLFLRQNAFFVRIQMFEGDAGTASDTIVRILRELGRDTRAAIHELGHLSQLACAAGKDNAVVNNVRGELRRRLL